MADPADRSTRLPDAGTGTGTDAGVTIGMALPRRVQEGGATIVMGSAAQHAGASSDPAPGSAACSTIAAHAAHGAHGAARAAPAAPTAAPASPRYAIVGHAGSGGMAVVHVAHDLELLRTVALKQLAAEIASGEPARQRFLREVQITAQLDHPHIVPVYGLEVAPDGSPAYAMKFVDGRTLEDLLAQARAAVDAGAEHEQLALPARIEHFLKVCDAVDYAHARGVIHRDLKPANVMIGPHNEIYVMDWGICRLFGRDDAEAERADATAAGPSGAGPSGADRSAHGASDSGPSDHGPAGAPARESVQTRAGSPAGLRTLDDGSGGGQTEVGAVVGTPRYMSPEQAQGRTELLGPRSDQCALGLILFELVALVPAVPGTTAYEMLVAAAHGRRAPLQHWRTGKPVPRPLRAIIERATALHPEQRYQSVRALADDLRRYLRGDAVQAIPDSAWQKALRYVGRHRQQVLFALVGLVAIAALGFALLLQRHEQALLQQQARAAHLRALVDDVGAHGDELQLRLLRLQGELDALATAAAQLLLHGNPAADARMFWSGQFEDPAARPPDFAPQPGFAVPVSLAHGVWAHPPSVDRADAGLQLQARRLHALLPLRNALYAEARAVLGDGSGDGGVSAFVLALPSGLSVRYPGRVIAADAHDARSTPWYREAIDSPGVHWGAPYAEAGSGRLLLPLSEPLRNPGGGALGVASIELSLEYLVHNLLGGADASDGVTLLLDAAGRVIASEQVLRNGEGGAGTLQAFAEPALLAALQHADSGVVESNAFGRAELIAFDRIHPLEWVLVTRFDDGVGRGQGVGRE